VRSTRTWAANPEHIATVASGRDDVPLVGFLPGKQIVDAGVCQGQCKLRSSTKDWPVCGDVALEASQAAKMSRQALMAQCLLGTALMRLRNQLGHGWKRKLSGGMVFLLAIALLGCSLDSAADDSRSVEAPQPVADPQAGAPLVCLECVPACGAAAAACAAVCILQPELCLGCVEAELGVFGAEAVGYCAACAAGCFLLESVDDDGTDPRYSGYWGAANPCSKPVTNRLPRGGP
jgi:hypothetical protein